MLCIAFYHLPQSKYLIYISLALHGKNNLYYKSSLTPHFLSVYPSVWLFVSLSILFVVIWWFIENLFTKLNITNTIPFNLQRTEMSILSPSIINKKTIFRMPIFIKSNNLYSIEKVVVDWWAHENGERALNTAGGAFSFLYRLVEYSDQIPHLWLRLWCIGGAMGIKKVSL